MFENLPQSLESLCSSVLTESVNALKHNNYTDNFDFDRFGVDGSEEFHPEHHAFYIEWFIGNIGNIFAAYSCLKSVEDKRLYLHLLAYRLAGHLCVKLPLSYKQSNDAYVAYKEIERSRPSDLPINGMLGGLKHFDFEYEGHRYVIDCVNLESYLFRKQYFYRKNGLSIAPEVGDIVIDGGACLGDSALAFSNAVGPAGLVYAFDPIADHIQIISRNREQFTHNNVVVVPFGLSDKDEICDPLVLDMYSPGFKIKDQKVPLRSLDSMVNDGEITNIDFIKLDIEGSELSAIRGAIVSINRFKPKLAISLYHKHNDIFEIILYIKQNFAFYDFYMDHYSIHSEETVLYCYPRKELFQSVTTELPDSRSKAKWWKTLFSIHSSYDQFVPQTDKES